MTVAGGVVALVLFIFTYAGELVREAREERAAMRLELAYVRGLVECGGAARPEDQANGDGEATPDAQ